MYRIINESGEKVFNFKSKMFMESFEYMNEHHPDSYIVYQTKNNTQIVWNPLWENMDCERLV